MRKLFALVAAAAILVLSACSSKPAANTDPYQVLDQATQASYGDLIQANLGLDVTGGAQNVHVDPSAITLVMDTKAGKVDVALALPLDALQIDAATRTQWGLTGDSLDLDVRFDGSALYTKSPILQPVLSALVLQSGGTPGDYSGWVRLGTVEELKALAGSIVPGISVPPMASASPFASHDAASLKADLEKAGITLTYVGREQRNGTDADHLTAAVDASKLENSPMASEVPAAQFSQLQQMLSSGDLKADLWFAADSHRLMEVDATVSGLTDASASASGGEKVSFTMLLSTPKDASALQAPADYSTLPLAPIIQSLMQSFGQGLFTTP